MRGEDRRGEERKEEEEEEERSTDLVDEVVVPWSRVGEGEDTEQAGGRQAPLPHLP